MDWYSKQQAQTSLLDEARARSFKPNAPLSPIAPPGLASPTTAERLRTHHRSHSAIQFSTSSLDPRRIFDPKSIHPEAPLSRLVRNPTPTTPTSIEVPDSIQHQRELCAKMEFILSECHSLQRYVRHTADYLAAGLV
eukprot:gnl/Hemi2/10576_TR3659_c0_g1_i1.p1 gnl/Hemi2/10576_TR3659_c0_g1~~gnl/Hemi2/10576_TR3659_c0_g1_i1.p1  ORF type:complete len:137 (-),score=30.65 gnl/Hemi2/10576_TR3659_c0_g1_i1:161-571(-)